MNTSQLQDELLRHTKGLSSEALHEVIDFVQFLRHKHLKSKLDNLSQEISLMSADQTAHLEKEFEDYKKLYPSE